LDIDLDWIWIDRLHGYGLSSIQRILFLMPFDADDHNTKISAAELRRRLSLSGYDTDAIVDLSRALRLDLFEILAAWAPITAGLLHQSAEIIPMPPPKRLPWWRRLWRWFVANRR
jgi:hypothetical protein